MRRRQHIPPLSTRRSTCACSHRDQLKHSGSLCSEAEVREAGRSLGSAIVATPFLIPTQPLIYAMIAGDRRRPHRFCLSVAGPVTAVLLAGEFPFASRSVPGTLSSRRNAVVAEPPALSHSQWPHLLCRPVSVFTFEGSPLILHQVTRGPCAVRISPPPINN